VQTELQVPQDLKVLLGRMELQVLMVLQELLDHKVNKV